nr:hypothetical protein [Tanacetum cinerariifolium]
MSTPKFADVHNLVAFLSKPIESEEFKQIIDFLNANPIKYALTMNPTIYTSCIEQFWATATAKNINEEQHIHAKVDGKKVIITEVTIRRDLKFEDEGGVDCLSNEVIFKQLPLTGMVKYLDGGTKFLMYPRFVQVFLDKQVDGMSKHNAIYVIPSHTKKVFSNMRRVGKDFSGNDTPLFPTMLVPTQEAELGEDKALNEENVPAQSNDPPLSRVNTLGSRMDKLKLKELMEICTNLQQRVIDLENTKTIKRLEKKRRVEEKRRKSPTKAQKRNQMCVYLKNMTGFTHCQLKNKSFNEVQKTFDKTMSWINSFVPMDSEVVKDKVEPTQENSLKRAGVELDQQRSKKQKVEDDKESEELKRCLEIILDDEDDVTIDATPLSIKTPIINYKIYKEGKKSYF